MKIIISTLFLIAFILHSEAHAQVWQLQDPNFPGNTTPYAVICTNTTDASDRYLILLNDIHGKLMYRSENEMDGQWTQDINIASLPSGTYTLTIATQKGVRTASVIKVC